MNTEPIIDASGRLIAPPQTVLAVRPMGPWTQNTAPLHIVCAWCQCVLHNGDRSQPTSHGICQTCAVVFEAGQ